MRFACYPYLPEVGYVYYVIPQTYVWSKNYRSCQYLKNLSSTWISVNHLCSFPHWNFSKISDVIRAKCETPDWGIIYPTFGSGVCCIPTCSPTCPARNRPRHNKVWLMMTRGSGSDSWGRKSWSRRWLQRRDGPTVSREWLLHCNFAGTR